MKRKYLFQYCNPYGGAVYKCEDKEMEVKILVVSRPMIEKTLGINPKAEIYIDDKEVQ